MIETDTEKYIGEMLMATINLPGKLLSLLITNRGLHFIFFKNIPFFEIAVLILVWLCIFLGAILTGFNKFAVFSLILLIISLIYILDQNRIQNQWTKFVKMNVKEKIHSNSINVHLKKDDILNICLENDILIISTNNKTFRFNYYNDGYGFYKNGADPFQKNDIKISQNKKEFNLENFFSI